MSSASRMQLYKVVVLGDGGVGKTALTIQLCLNHFVETYDPTIEDSYRKQIQVDGTIALLEVLDTAGQEEYTALRDQWIRDGEGFLLVYSIASRNSFERMRKFVDQIVRVKDLDYQSIPLMLIGNKSDKTLEREVPTVDGITLSKVLGCEFLETSAKTSQNVEEAFHSCVRRIRVEKGQQPATDLNQITPQISPPQINQASNGNAIRQSNKTKKDKKCVIM